MEDWLETLDFVLQNGVRHISAYSLQIEKDTPWFEMQKKGELPYMDEDLEREMYARTMEKLGQAGLCHYEISNFARPGFESRHNLKYWTGSPYVGIGAAAHSFIEDTRAANISNPLEYMRKIKDNESPQISREPIGFEEKVSERFFLGLRLIRGVSLTSLEKEFGSQAVERYRETIRQLEDRKLVVIEGDMLRLTKQGLDYANQVWMEFL
jgi:oxygen-independent coproporphyrinogen-3 oxidase